LPQLLFGTPEKYIDCQTKDRISMRLNALLDEEDWEWERLSDLEQSFLPSVRQQIAQRSTLTEKQYQTLELIGETMNR
jgi:hypothetical protein